MVKIFVGYGFSLPSKLNFLNIQNLLSQKFLFIGRLKPYPTELYIVGVNEQGRSPVGRVALIPTLTYLLKYMIVQWKFSYQFLINKKHLLYANSCRDEGNPTYSCLNIKSLSERFYFLLILLNGALKSLTVSDQCRLLNSCPVFSGHYLITFIKLDDPFREFKMKNNKSC